MLNSIKPIVKKMPVIKTYVQKLQKEKEKATEYQKNRNRIGNLRERIKRSLDIYSGYAQ